MQQKQHLFTLSCSFAFVTVERVRTSLAIRTTSSVVQYIFHCPISMTEINYVLIVGSSRLSSFLLFYLYTMKKAILIIFLNSKSKLITVRSQ